MIKLKFLIILTTILLTFNSNAAFEIKARTAILQDYLSGEVFLRFGLAVCTLKEKFENVL